MTMRRISKFHEKTEWFATDTSRNSLVKLWIISYDLGYGEEAKKALEQIKEFEWAEISESCYIIETNLQLKSLYSLFSEFINPWKKLSISPFVPPFCGFYPVETCDFFADRFENQD